MASITANPAILDAGMQERKSSMSPTLEVQLSRTQLPIGGARRASDGVLDNMTRIATSSSAVALNVGWARRPIATNSIGTERERAQLLRSVSHLPKVETTIASPTTTVESSNQSPFSRYDLVPPPNYRARSSQKPLGRVRGWSVSEDRRANFYSALNNTSNSNNASSLSLSQSTTNLAAQGKAKAVSAAAKFRKQLGGNQRSEASSASRMRSSSTSSELNLDVDDSNSNLFQSPSGILNVDAERQLGARIDSRSAPEEELLDATQTIPLYSSSRHRPSTKLCNGHNVSQTLCLQSVDLDASTNSHFVADIPDPTFSTAPLRLSTSTLTRRPSQSEILSSSKNPCADQKRESSQGTSFNQLSSPSTTDHLAINYSNSNEERSFVRISENSPSSLISPSAQSSSTASTSTAVNSNFTSSNLASPPRTPKISFDLSRHLRFGSADFENSRLGNRRFTPQSNAVVVANSNSMMKAQGRNTAADRRGLAPNAQGDGKIKTSFKLGMMRLTGSTVDLTQFGSDNRRGSHLERSSIGEDTNDDGVLASSPISTNDESASPRHRFSFSMTRQRQSQDVPKASSFSFSKMNRSRDTLQLSADDGTFREPGSRRKSDASFITRQFLSKALKRPSRQDLLPPQDSALSSAPQSRPVTQDIRSSSPANTSGPESANQVFATAFGTPQKSDAHTAQAFEGNVSSEASFQQHSRRGTSSVRASQDSIATSFFSTAETSSNMDSTSRPTSRYFAPEESSPASPFGSFRGNSRFIDQGTGSPRSLARPISAGPGEQQEEGPMGERRQESEDAVGLSCQLSALVLSDLPKPVTTKATSNIISSSTGSNVSPSEQGSITTHHSRFTAPSSMPASVSIPSPTTQHSKRAELSPALTEEIQSTKPNQPTVIAKEQDFFNSAEALESSTNNTSRNGGGGGSGSGGYNRRAGRSSRLLHLPRLNSLHLVSGASNGTSGGDEDGNDGNDERRSRETSVGGADEQSSETDSGEETGGDETQEEENSDHDSHSSTEISVDSEAERESHRNSVQLSRNDSGGITRSRPGDIVLPPAPSFASPIATSSIPTANLFSEVVGRDSWEQFNLVETPLETPQAFSTPRPIQNTMTASPSSLQQRNNTSSANTNFTPKGTTANEGDNSYFDLRPTTPRTVTGNGVNIPPPSPSIITRSRAAFSASRRSVRSSLRDLPPMPPMLPLKLRGMDSTSLRTKSPSRSVVTTSSSPLRAEPSKHDSLTPLPSYRQAPPPKVALVNESRTPTTAAQAPFAFVPSNKVAGRPGLYQQQSQSLIELNSAKILREPLAPPAPIPAAGLTGKDSPVYGAADSGLQTPTGSSTPGGVRRRRSMFEVGAQPPPYAVVHDRPEGKQMISPREEEGKESLPRYTCSVHIEGYLPRKMEFSSPGLQAKDRSWKRQYFVLHGTCLKVYKSDLSGENLVGKVEWGEVDGVHVHKEPMNEDGPVGPAITASHAKEGSNISSSNQGYNNHSLGNSNSSSGFNAAVEAVSALKGSIYHSNKTGLIKTYSLQGAESGLAADYLKRRHVVRIRVEGEQFLLQTRNDRHVVNWIEAFQAATNVSLDLERRPMPKFITLPRRRRRRRENGAAADPNSTLTAREEAEIAEAQRRSVAENQSGGSNRPTSSRLPPARPLGLPRYESSPHSSATMDDMLREEHESMMRQDASDV